MLLTFKKRHSVINIWEPRYHDRKVLIATHKVAERNKIIIEKGSYKGEYFVSGVVASAYHPVSNGKIMCYPVPISQLERI